jgi:hypothetical protein
MTGIVEVDFFTGEGPSTNVTIHRRSNVEEKEAAQ